MRHKLTTLDALHIPLLICCIGVTLTLGCDSQRNVKPPSGQQVTAPDRQHNPSTMGQTEDTVMPPVIIRLTGVRVNDGGSTVPLTFVMDDNGNLRDMDFHEVDDFTLQSTLGLRKEMNRPSTRHVRLFIQEEKTTSVSMLGATLRKLRRLTHPETELSVDVHLKSLD